MYKGKERELGKLPGGGDFYPVSRVDLFSSKMMRTGEGKEFPAGGGTCAEAGRGEVTGA